MKKISINKSKTGHYTLTVRDDKGSVVLQDKFSTLDAAQRLASVHRTPTYAQLRAALGRSGK